MIGRMICVGGLGLLKDEEVVTPCERLQLLTCRKNDVMEYKLVVDVPGDNTIMKVLSKDKYFEVKKILLTKIATARL